MNNEPTTNQTPDLTPEETTTPVPPAPPQAQTEFSTPPAPKRSKKPLIAGILAALVVVVGAGSVLGYTMWYQNPDKVVHDAVLNMIKAKTAVSTGSIKYENDSMTMDIALNGKANETSGELTIDAKIAVDEDGTAIEIEAEGVARYIDDALYIKVGGITELANDVVAQTGGELPPSFQPIFDKIENRWISIKPSDYEDFNEDISKQQACISDLMKKIQKEDSMMDEVVNLYKKNQIIQIEDELGTKDVNGTSSLGYKINIDKDKTASFAEGLGETEFGKAFADCDDTVDFKKFSEDITKNTADDKNAPTMELWVSKFGHTITQVSIYGDDGNGGDLNITLQPTFNDDVTVEAPKDATSLTTVLEEIQDEITRSFSEMYSEETMLPSDSSDMGGEGDGVRAEYDSFLQPAI